MPAILVTFERLDLVTTFIEAAMELLGREDRKGNHPHHPQEQGTQVIYHRHLGVLCHHHDLYCHR